MLGGRPIERRRPAYLATGLRLREKQHFCFHTKAEVMAGSQGHFERA
jgi:hypothetical protein